MQQKTPPISPLETGKDSYLHHINMNQKSRPGAGESLLTWSSKQTEGRPDAFQSMHRTFAKAGVGIREKGQEDMHIQIN